MEKKPPLGRGKIGFKTANLYAVPIAKVWDAITKAKHQQKFFVGKVTGDFGPKLETVMWHWKKYGSFPLWPTVFQKEKKLEFVWESHSKKYLTTVTFTLKKKGKNVEVEIEERGWQQKDTRNAFDNCQGWTQYLAYLKTYLQHGIDLRTEKQ